VASHFADRAAWLGSVLSVLLISVTVMAQECPISAPLTIKDMQSGYAGETGTVWTIAPDCSYTVARQIGLKILDPDKQGRLTAEQQSRLKELLDRMPPAGLPTQLGSGSQVNARRISLSYRQAEAVLTLAPGGGDLGRLRAAADTAPAAILLEFAEQVKKMTSG
jgi:hypothetical protein